MDLIRRSKMYIWYSRSTSGTGRALARELNLKRFSFRSREYGTVIPPKQTELCLNWGSQGIPERKKHLLRFRRIKYLNHPDVLSKTRDKLYALQRMKSYDVSVPKFTEDSLSASELGFPIIGRTRFHQGGSGFRFIQNQEELRRDTRSEYWIKFQESKMEYRVHVFLGEVFRIQRKREKEGQTVNHHCRSHNNGWYFSLCDLDRVHPSVKEESIKAVKALRYDFGAVDVIRNPDTDETFVLEVNSSPGLDSAGLEAYKEKINEWRRR